MLCEQVKLKKRKTRKRKVYANERHNGRLGLKRQPRIERDYCKMNVPAIAAWQRTVAITMAMLASVTVSIGELTTGEFNLICLVRFVAKLT